MYVVCCHNKTFGDRLDHPVKKFKPDGKDHTRNNRFGKLDIYSMYNHNGVSLNNNNNDLTNNINTKNQFIKQEIIAPESGAAENEMTAPSGLPSHGMKRPGDPYEFDEEGAGSGCIDGFKRGQAGVKEEPKDLKKLISRDLFTREGLQPSYKDLDQIFDNDDTSSDEAVSFSFFFNYF